MAIFGTYAKFLKGTAQGTDTYISMEEENHRLKSAGW